MSCKYTQMKKEFWVTEYFGIYIHSIFYILPNRDIISVSSMAYVTTNAQSCDFAFLRSIQNRQRRLPKVKNFLLASTSVIDLEIYG